jgi:hypothetical protein
LTSAFWSILPVLGGYWLIAKPAPRDRLPGCLLRKGLSVSIEPEDDDTKAERKSEAMKAQTRKDVETWTKARNEAATKRISEPSAPVDRPASFQPVSSGPVPRAKKPHPRPPTAEPADIQPTPFSMAYGGETTKAYIRSMIDRGSR